MPQCGRAEEVEHEVGQAEGKLVAHRAAFARTSVIQAFLGSAPQLTLQLYICVLQRDVSIGRGEGKVIDIHMLEMLELDGIYNPIVLLLLSWRMCSSTAPARE